MFDPNKETGNITMHAGDTGSYTVYATRESGTAWTADDRMVFTVANASGVVMLQRYYRLDTSLGNGKVLIEFHNGDTDEWPAGNYTAERRYVVNPRWDGTVPTGNVTDALAEGIAHIIDGDTVRTPKWAQTTITINRVYGEV
jgi:hypothetical protein